MVKEDYMNLLLKSKIILISCTVFVLLVTGQIVFL